MGESFLPLRPLRLRAWWYHLATARMEFFEKYRQQNVGTTRARLAELISIFEAEREHMTISELEDLRIEMDELTEKLRVERDGL